MMVKETSVLWENGLYLSHLYFKYTVIGQEGSKLEKGKQETLRKRKNSVCSHHPEIEQARQECPMDERY